MSHVDRWKNRRRMAWLALLAGLAYPLLILFTDSPELGSIAGPYYIFVGAVVGAYIGFATIDDKWTNDARHEIDPRFGLDRRDRRSYRRMDRPRMADDETDRPVDWDDGPDDPRTYRGTGESERGSVDPLR